MAHLCAVYETLKLDPMIHTDQKWKKMRYSTPIVTKRVTKYFYQKGYKRQRNYILIKVSMQQKYRTIISSHSPNNKP